MGAEDTKTMILDAAERLFAEHGFAATSLRNIIAEAGVNLAAVHYHFGSKEALIKAVLERRIVPMNEERLRMLDLVEARGGASAIDLEGVVEALIGPPLRLRGKDKDKKSGDYFMKIIGRTFAEADSRLKEMFFAMFEQIAQRFFPAFKRSCPNIPPETLFWRCHFVIGAMAHTMCDKESVEYYAKGVCDPNDVERIIDELVQFSTAGLKATPRLPNSEPLAGLNK